MNRYVRYGWMDCTYGLLAALKGWITNRDLKEKDSLYAITRNFIQ